MRSARFPLGRRRRLGLALVLPAAACGRDASPVVDGERDAAPTVADADARDLDASPADARAPGEDDCRPDGEFALTVLTNGLDRWDGELVVVAAVERTMTEVTRVALLNASIADGGFSVGCPAALSETLDYPSIAAYVDLDGSGACSAADVGYQDLRFGWNGDVTLEVPAGSEHWAPIADGLTGPDGDDFCLGYFD